MSELLTPEMERELTEYQNSEQFRIESRAHELTTYSVEELSAELDRRAEAAMVPEMFAGTLDMLHKFTSL